MNHRSRNMLGMVFALSSAVVAQDQPSDTPSANALTKQQLAVFAVLDALDNTDTADLPLVRVAWQRAGNAPSSMRVGFVITTDAGVTRIRHLDGSYSSITADVARHELDLNAELRRVTVWATTGKNNSPSSLMVRLLFLARAAAREGERRLVHQAWEALPEELTDAKRLRNSSLSACSERRLTLDFADPEVSYEQLKQRHKNWLEAFPEAAAGIAGGKKGAVRRANSRPSTSLRSKVKARLKLIEQTLASLKQTTPGADDDIVLQLRNARFSPVTRRDPWRPVTRHAKSKSPSIQERIVSKDLSVVPLLIDAMHSGDLTRCVRKNDIPMTFLTVRELAHELLKRIAGYPVTAAPSRSKWQAWHEKVQADGLRKVMEAELKQGNDAVITPYLKRWPKQWPRIITLIEHPETNITATLAMLRGLPKQLPRQALLAGERVLASKRRMLFKQMVAEQLVTRTAPDGENALRAVLQNSSIDADTRKQMSRLLPH